MEQEHHNRRYGNELDINRSTGNRSYRTRLLVIIWRRLNESEIWKYVCEVLIDIWYMDFYSICI